MILHITHTTEYSYDTAVAYALQKVRLTPSDGPLQTVQNWELEVTGGQIEAQYTDHYGNIVHLISAAPETQNLTITASGNVETHDLWGVLGQSYTRAPLWHFKQATALITAGPQVRALADHIDHADALAALHKLSAEILGAVAYETGHTGADTTAEDAMSAKFGVCQDHANIFIAAARHAGIPARYVSGYLKMEDRTDQDASHAWAEAHLPGLGWVGFDVSNGYSPDGRYVRLAIGRDSSDAAPITGMRHGPGDETLIVSLQVQQ